MKTETFCQFLGCNSRDFSPLHYIGQQYCKTHYDRAFLSDLMNHFNEWDETTDPPDRLKYLIGRYYSEHEIPLIGEPSLTKAIVHERSYNWKKTDDSAVFTTIRYPINRRLGEPYCDEVHETWQFNISELKYVFLSEDKKGYFGMR